MRLVRTHQPATCPYRLLDEENHEVTWVNDFLDAQHLRQLSPRSLRAYAYDLLHFARWFHSQPQALSEITESTLLDYVRHQLTQQPQPTPQTVNHRLTVIRCLYRFHLGQEIPSGRTHFQRTYSTRCPVGYGRPHRNVAFGLRLKQPRRVIQPLSGEQASSFWASFRTFRDLAVVGLMLLDGLRSCEILSLQLEDLKLADARQRLLCLRRLLSDLAAQGHHLQPGLIILEDLPTLPEYLPRPLSPEDDHRLQDELRRKDDLYSNALLLTRMTGIRIGECIHLPIDCLRQIGPEQWALHVPLGKLHTERLVPLDSEGLWLLRRILELRATASPARLLKSKDFLLLRVGGRFALFQTLRVALADAAKRAGCTDSKPISPHRLRHTWATELLNCGIGLPALMKLMGHKSIQMTLRYLKVAQPDLQREFYRARQNSPHTYILPSLSVSTATPDLPGIRQAVAATRHLLEMYRRQFSDDKTRRRLQRLDHRFLAIAQQLQKIAAPEK